MIEEYYNHIKEKVYRQLKWLPVNLEGEGIEEIKMYYENVIKKYSFLKEIIDPIFPMIFEPPDLEVQKAILEGELAMNCFPNSYKIEKIGNLEYEETLVPEEDHIIMYHIDYNEVKEEMIPIKQRRTKVPYRIVYVKDSKTGEKKEIKMYGNSTVQPL